MEGLLAVKLFKDTGGKTAELAPRRCFGTCQLLISRAGSKGRRNTCAQFTRGSLKAQSFSRALI